MTFRTWFLKRFFPKKYAQRLEAKRETRRRRERYKWSREIGQRRYRHSVKLGIQQVRVGFDMKPKD